MKKYWDAIKKDMWGYNIKILNKLFKANHVQQWGIIKVAHYVTPIVHTHITFDQLY